MRDLLTLTEYQLRAIRKPLLFLLLTMGPLQFLCAAGQLWWIPSTLDVGYVTPDQLATGGLILLIPAAFVAAAALVNFLVTARQNGRSKSIYTLMTLPVRRWKLYAAGVLSGLIAVCAVIAAEALWYLLLYAPLCAVSGAVERHWSGIAQTAFDGPGLPHWEAASPFLQNGLFLSMVRAAWMRLLLPLSPGKALLLAAHLFAGISCLQAIPTRQGAARVLHGALLAGSVVLCLYALGTQLLVLLGLVSRQLNELPVAAVQLGLGLAAWLSAVQSLARAKNL